MTKRYLILLSAALVQAVILSLFVQPTVVYGQKKITDLTADTSPTTDDLIETVNNPGGSPGSRKVTFDNITKGLNASNFQTGLLPVARGGTGLDTSASTGVPLITAGVWSILSTTGTGNLVRETNPTIVTPTIASFTNATHNHQNAAGGGQLDHGLALTGLGDDDHTQYLLLAGRTGGQTLVAGTGAGDSFIINATPHATPGLVSFLETGGHIRVGGAAAASELRLREPNAGGTIHYSAFVSQAQAANITYTLPAADGSDNQTLTTNGSGLLTWETPAGGGSPGGSDKQIQFNNSSAFGGATGFEYQSGSSPNVKIVGQSAAHAALQVLGHSANSNQIFQVISGQDGTSRILSVDGDATYPQFQNAVGFLHRTANEGFFFVGSGGAEYGISQNYDAASGSSYNDWGWEIGVEVKINKDAQFNWYDDNFNATTETADTGLGRDAAGVVKVTNGTSGFGKLKLGTNGTAVASIMSNTATLDFPDCAPGVVADLTITVTGAAAGDSVAIGIPNGSVTATGAYYAWVSAADTVTIRFLHSDVANNENPASGTFRATVTKF